MSAPGDPGWIGAAETVFSACLWLYPKQLRDAHGVEMRQAFRDRCREVVRGERSAFRVLALEIFPDTLLSAGREQFSASFDDMRPRQLWALGLLICAALGLLLQDKFSRYALDYVFRAKYAIMNWRDAREMGQREEQVRLLAAHLQESTNPEQQALAAYLYRSMYTGRTLFYFHHGDDKDTRQFEGRLPEEGHRATSVAVRVMAAHPDVYPLSISVQSCDVAVGCDRGAAIAQLTSRDPDNGFGWSLAFKWAAQRGDTAAMAAAARRMAQSTYYEDYRARIAHDLVDGAKQLSPADPEFQATIAIQVRNVRYLATEDFRHDIRRQCTPRSANTAPADRRWIDQHPDARRDCLRIARLLAGSTNLFGSRWGWKRIVSSETDPDLRARAYQQLRASDWLWLRSMSTVGSTDLGGRRWAPWEPADWQQWAASWSPGDSELAATRRWLASRGHPIDPPADFQVTLN